jgi:glycosyltransferase involved in cell wall biosynthesis/CBS domain-containing protein
MRKMDETGSYLKDVLSLPLETNMRAAPPTVSALDTVSTVMDLMEKENVGSIVAVENNLPVGIITEKDMLQRVIRPGKDLELTRVRDVMSEPLITIEAERTIADALEALSKHNIRRLIVTRKGVLVGITTERRLLEITHAHYVMKDRGLLRNVVEYEAHKIRIAYVSTYPPRECGIATYTRHLVDATSTFCARAVRSPAVVAVNEKGGHYDYGIAVKVQINADEVESYEKAAEYINSSDIDIVNLQHEYGIFEGEWGKYILAFLDKLEKPVITTLHTVLQEPPLDAKRVLERVLQHSNSIVVMATIGKKILEQLYGSFGDKTQHIPHGCPNVPFIETTTTKQSLALHDRVVLSTFGLLSGAKGIEYAIEALPQIVQKFPEVLYMIIGETHPEVRKREGETYRQRLLNLVDSLRLEKNVRFVNRFLTENELIRYLQATDVYILPYPSREQISSGTLSYALSTGKAIVTTPFLQAEEAISKGAAMGCKFRDPSSIGECVITLLKDHQVHQRYRRMAYEYGRAMIWPNVAMKYVNLFYNVLGL